MFVPNLTCVKEIFVPQGTNKTSQTYRCTQRFIYIDNNFLEALANVNKCYQMVTYGNKFLQILILTNLELTEKNKFKPILTNAKKW